MKFPCWTHAIIDGLRERHFWNEVLREAFYRVKSSSSSLGITLAFAMIEVSHRALRTTRTARPASRQQTDQQDAQHAYL